MPGSRRTSLNTAMPFDMVITSRVGWQFAASVGTMAITGLAASEGSKLDALLGALEHAGPGGASGCGPGRIATDRAGLILERRAAQRSFGIMALAGRIVVGNTAASRRCSRMGSAPSAPAAVQGTLGEIT